MIKINRRLKKLFGDETKLKERIKEEITADTNGNVSVDNLKDFVIGLCHQDMIDKKITKRDVEGFLSAFSYNAYGATNVNSISELIFTRDDLITEKLAERKWANPPPSDCNKEFQTEGIDEKNCHNSRIRNILTQIEDKVFGNNKVKMFHVFRKFDKDCDGYVSYDDFEKCLQQIKVDASKSEISHVMKLLDKNNHGYLNYTDFSKVFGNTMSTKLVQYEQNDVYFNNLWPNRETNADNIQKQD